MSILSLLIRESPVRKWHIYTCRHCVGFLIFRKLINIDNWSQRNSYWIDIDSQFQAKDSHSHKSHSHHNQQSSNKYSGENKDGRAQKRAYGTLESWSDGSRDRWVLTLTHAVIGQCRNSSGVHTWISTPFPIRITLIRITLHGMDSYINPLLRLPLWQPFNPD